MSSDKKTRFQMTPVRTVILYFIVLVLVLTAIGLMDMAGYKMISYGVTFALFGMLVCSLLILAIWAIARRIQGKILRYLVIGLGSVFIFGVAMVLMNFFSFMQLSSMPREYAQLESPSGKKAVVFQLHSFDEDRINARVQKRVAAGEDELEEDEIYYSDLGFRYSAYPKKLLFFYDSRADVSGELEIGVNSQAKLMHEWIDDNSLRLYIENPEIADGGEWHLNMK